MLSTLHSYFKPLCLVLLVLMGLACGHLADSLLQIKLRPDLSISSPASRTFGTKPRQFAETDLNLILQQNVFDADSRSASAAMILADDAEQTSQPEVTVAPADLKLIGTVVAGMDSLALIENRGELKIFHLEDEIPGGVIETIERSQVTIRTSGQRLITLFLHEGKKGPGTDSRPPIAKPAENRQAQSGDELSGTIKEVGENRWMVSADMVESVRENFAAELRLAQMQPRLVDGQTSGFLVRRINPRSVLAKMGIQRGDVVIDVNNIKLDSPEKALQIFQQLREARNITVAVERNGQPMSFVYEIE